MSSFGPLSLLHGVCDSPDGLGGWFAHVWDVWGLESVLLGPSLVFTSGADLSRGSKPWMSGKFVLSRLRQPPDGGTCHRCLTEE